MHREDQSMVAALLQPIFNADDRGAARARRRCARTAVHRLPKVATLLGEIEADLSSSSYLTQSLDRCGLYLFRTLNYE